MTMALLLGVAAAHSPMENPMFWLPYIGVTICLGTVGFLLWRFMVRYDGVSDADVGVLSFLRYLLWHFHQRTLLAGDCNSGRQGWRCQPKILRTANRLAL